MAAKTKADMGFFERNLTWWVFACIAVGIGLGKLLPGVFQAVGGMEVASVNLPVAVLIWLMIVPMMVNVDFHGIVNVGRQPKGLIVTSVVNWLIKPFSMALLAWLFFGTLFAAWITPADAAEYTAGLIILAAAPCTAMVFVWSYLCDGDPNYTLVQVSFNDLVMIVAFAPIVGFLLGLSDIHVPYATLLLSVVLYIVIPLGVGTLLRRHWLRRGGQARLEAMKHTLGPVSIGALLLTLVLLFGFQGEKILAEPLVIGLIAIPILIQVYFNAALVYGWGWLWRVPHNVSAPGALIGASNFFELAVAVAIGLFGFDSGAALATVVGVLVEVPVMLTVVAFVNRSRERYLLRSMG